MATTEEMNRDIAEYDGYFKVVDLKDPVTLLPTWHYVHPILNVSISHEVLIYTNENDGWSRLMPVWKKLRGELESLGMSAMTNGRAVDIHFAIVAVDIESAHSLIHSAIVFLNKNKK